MVLYKKIQSDMYTAMKDGEKEKASTLRTVLAKLKDKQIQNNEASFFIGTREEWQK